MKQLITLVLLFVCFNLPSWTQTPNDTATNRPFAGHFYCAETDTHIYLNLYEESLTAPGFSFLGKMHGYMNGGIYGTWMLISHKTNGKKATLRFSNDIGSDSQNIEFTQTSDSTFTYHAVGGNAIRRAVGRKLVKVTDSMQFKKLQNY